MRTPQSLSALTQIKRHSQTNAGTTWTTADVGFAACPSWVKRGRAFAGQNPPMTAVPRKRTRFPSPLACKASPFYLTMMLLRELLVTVWWSCPWLPCGSILVSDHRRLSLVKVNRFCCLYAHFCWVFSGLRDDGLPPISCPLAVSPEVSNDSTFGVWGDDFCPSPELARIDLQS